MIMEKPNKKEFEIYCYIQHGGKINMLDMNAVVELSGGVLTQTKLMYIYNNYSSLQKEYGVN